MPDDETQSITSSLPVIQPPSNPNTIRGIWRKVSRAGHASDMDQISANHLKNLYEKKTGMEKQVKKKNMEKDEVRNLIETLNLYFIILYYIKFSRGRKDVNNTVDKSKS